MKTVYRTRLLCLVILTVLSQEISAFEGWEHEAVSKLSFVAARNYIAKRHAGNTNLAELEKWSNLFAEGLRHNSSGPAITFGRLVKLVDYMRDPYDMLHPTNSSEALPIDVESANVAFLEDLGGNFASLASAAHLNFNHFQGRALYSFWFWHKQAIEAASENLFAGLLLEAYAQHYLQDFFAPGHIVAPRDEDSHDLFAMSLHDYFNKSGLGYLVRDTNSVWDFAESLRSLHNHMEVGLDEGVFVDRDKTIIFSSNSLNAFLLQIISTQAVVCLGDKKMTSNPQQLPLMVTYCGRAILDVMESFVSKRAVNHFARYRWNALLDSGAPTLELVDLSLSFGNLTCVNLERPRLERVYNRFTRTFTSGLELTNYLVQESLTYASLMNPTLTFNLGGQSIASHGESHIRGLAEAMLVYAPFRLDEKFQSSWIPDQIGFGAGYSGVYDTRERGHGIVTRLVFPSPKLNLQLSVNAGVRYYLNHDVEGWGDFETIRLEWGMHLMNVFVGGGHDHYARLKSHDRRAGVLDGYVFEAGVNFGLPISRWTGNKWPLSPKR